MRKLARSIGLRNPVPAARRAARSVRRGFLAWLVVHGPDAFGLSPEEGLWFHYERDEDRDRGLGPTYLLRPDWQAAVPHGLTVFGWEELKAYLRDRYGVVGRWFEKAR